MSAERFALLGNRVSLIIFYGPKYTYVAYNKPQKWKVQVEFHDQGTKIEQETIGDSLTVALAEAFDKLDAIVSRGLGPTAMMPALEHKIEPAHVKSDDDIPF